MILLKGLIAVIIRRDGNITVILTFIDCRIVADDGIIDDYTGHKRRPLPFGGGLGKISPIYVLIKVILVIYGDTGKVAIIGGNGTFDGHVLHRADVLGDDACKGRISLSRSGNRRINRDFAIGDNPFVGRIIAGDESVLDGNSSYSYLLFFGVGTLTNGDIAALIKGDAAYRAVIIDGDEGKVVVKRKIGRTDEVNASHRADEIGKQRFFTA